MPAPSEAAVVSDPEPLTPTEFPFAVDPFPAQWLAEFGNVIAETAPDSAPLSEVNPLRFED